MTKQVFHLTSDATVLSDIHSLGAVIIRLKSEKPLSAPEDYTNVPFITTCKCLYIYEIGDSSKAELLAGLLALEHLFTEIEPKHINFKDSKWTMDIPHIDTIMSKFRQEEHSKVHLQTIDIIRENELPIKLPQSSKENSRHHLCHRICYQGRTFYENGDISTFKNNFQVYLKKISSDWIIL